MPRLASVALVLPLLLIVATNRAGSAPATAAVTASPAATSAMRESELRIPFPGTAILMRTRVARPSGDGPFRLAVISHGTNEDGAVRAQHVLPKYQAMVSLLVRRGYAVAVPQRPGHGETGGPYFESAGDCDFAEFAAAAHATAASIRVVVEYMRQQPYVRRSRAVLVGHSAGAWGSLALASRYPDLVESVINFSGGRGGRSYGIANKNCAPERLVEAAGDFGRTTRVPTLWLYSSNDSYFSPELARRMADAFRAAGGRVDFQVLPPFGTEGHFAIELSEAAPVWQPLVDAFLRKNQTSPQ
jgi:dienelactone hydrolase